MSYTGDVSVGGAEDTRVLPELRITKVAVGPMDNNAYFLECARTGDVMLIDAAAEPRRLLDVLGGRGLSRVLTTHRHPDHWQALPAVIEATGATVVAHPSDAGELPVAVREQVEHGDTVHVGDVLLRIIHLRGHTPGSIAVCYTPAVSPTGAGEADAGPHLFTGDSLFPGGPGNTHKDPQRFDQLMTDLEQRVFDRLPDDTWVYPGHGKDTTLGAERPHLGEWRARGW